MPNNSHGTITRSTSPVNSYEPTSCPDIACMPEAAVCLDGTCAMVPAPQGECVVVETRAVASNEPTPLGFSADEALADVAGPYTTELRYEEDGNPAGTAQLTVSFTSTGMAELVDEEWMSYDGLPQIEESCDRLNVGVTVDFATDDGRFAEQWDGDLVFTRLDAPSIEVQTPLGELQGTYQAPAEQLLVQIEIDDGMPSGEARIGYDLGGSDPVGSFGPDEDEE